MKKNGTIFLFFLCTSCIAQPKLDRKAIPYSEDHIKFLFLSYDEGVDWEKEYTVNFEIKATCNIDTLGNIINLKIENMNKLIATENFIKKRIMGSSGSWLPAIKNCTLVVSDTITFIFRKKTTKEQQDKIEIERAKCIYWDTNAKYYYTPSGYWGYRNYYEFDITYDCPLCTIKTK
jgi:hypothetical protein